MKVMFLNPPFMKGYSRESRSPCVTFASTIYYPYTLALGAGLVQEKGHEVMLIDSVTKDYSRKKTVQLVKDFDPDICVVDTSTPSIYNDLEVAEAIKETVPKTEIVLVGRHVTGAPEETLKLAKTTRIVARKEFYPALLELLEGKDLSKIKGISYKVDDKIKHNPDAELMDPNTFPFVSKIYKQFLDVNDYFYASLTNPYVLLYYGYGCPWNCSYCFEWLKSSYRHRSIDHLIEELKYIQKELPQVKEILFDDPTFVVDEENTIKLCNAMIENKIKLRWSVNTRCNLSDEVMKAMVKAGCRLSHVGVESLSQESLDSVTKGQEVDNVVDFLKRAKKAGLKIHGCFMIGLHSDTRKSVEETIEFAKKLPMDTIQVFPIIPYPGTSTWKWAEDNDYLTTKDYSKWLKPDGSYDCVVSRPELTNEEILELMWKFLRSWYYRPKYFGYKIGQSLTSLNEFKRNLTSFRSMLRRGL